VNPGISLILLGLTLLGTPLFVVIALVAMIGFFSADINLTAVPVELFRLADMPALQAIPLFTFAGYLLSASKAPQRLVQLTQTLLGWLPGGLAVVALTACAVFTAFTGASGVTIIALGSLLFPALLQAGYPERFSLGLITSSGSLGLLFAPSLPLILFAIVAQSMDQPVSVEHMFMAGIVPGALMLLVLAIYSGYVGHTQRPADHAHGPKPPLLRSVCESSWELPLPMLVLGGIYGGWLTVTEAAAMSTVYLLLVEVVIRREVGWRQLPAVARDSMALVGGVLIILGMSLASTNYMVDQEAPYHLFAFLNQVIHDKTTFLIVLTVFLLLLGMMLDIFSALVLMVPLLLPVAVHYGVHPVHFGILFLANMQLGYYTPPVGMNLFIASYRFDRPVMELYRASLPFFGLLLLVVLAITFFPVLSLGFLAP